MIPFQGLHMTNDSAGKCAEYLPSPTKCALQTAHDAIRHKSGKTCALIVGVMERRDGKVQQFEIETTHSEFIVLNKTP